MEGKVWRRVDTTVVGGWRWNVVDGVEVLICEFHLKSHQHMQLERARPLLSVHASFAIFRKVLRDLIVLTHKPHSFK